jgi:hypothetical protein
MITQDTSSSRKLNFQYLEIDFASLAADGNRIKSCVSSPDRTLNNLLKQYGSALYETGYSCTMWAASSGKNYTSACLNGLRNEKSLQTRVMNRIQYVTPG